MAEKKQPKYSDFSTSFARNPIQSDLLRISEFDAVKRSVRSLILTDKYERLLDPNIGGNIRALLFEPIDAATTITLRNAIESTLNNYEPRAVIREIVIKPDYDRQAYYVQITFSLIYSEQQAAVEFFLNRIR
jgi:phage baseplate assembly protein W